MAESMAEKIAKRLAASKSATTDSSASAVPTVRVVETETLKNDSKSGL